ncbi:hypothetical protein Tco_1312990 [Tanacetum coccineum]
MDYDGTLSIAQRDDPEKRAFQSIRMLASSPRMHSKPFPTAINSGRSREKVCCFVVNRSAQSVIFIKEPVDNTAHGFKPSIDAVSRGQMGAKGIRLPMRDNSVTNDVIAELFGVSLKTYKDIDDFTKGIKLDKYADALVAEKTNVTNDNFSDSVMNMPSEVSPSDPIV